jgi:hypothetical protein
MSVSYTTTKFLADVKRLGHFPTNQDTFQDSDLLALGDYELQTYILPMLVKVRENYLLKSQDYAAGAEDLLIPDRAIGGKLADLQLIVGANIEHLKYLEISQLDSTIGSPVCAFAFTIQDNRIEVIPSPSMGFVRAYFYCRPGKLVTTTECAQILSVDTALNQVVVSSLPSTITTSTVVDFIQNVSGFSIMAMDQTVSLAASTTLTFASLPDGLAAGDWIALAGESPIPQIPVELQPLLVQATVVKIYEIQGYLDKMNVAAKKLEKMTNDLMTLITPRVAEAPKVINAPPNGILNPAGYGYGVLRRY